jgi:hypothetical protein
MLIGAKIRIIAMVKLFTYICFRITPFRSYKILSNESDLSPYNNFSFLCIVQFYDGIIPGGYH